MADDLQAALARSPRRDASRSRGDATAQRARVPSPSNADLRPAEPDHLVAGPDQDVEEAEAEPEPETEGALEVLWRLWLVSACPIAEATRRRDAWPRETLAKEGVTTTAG
jgi:hypothetical protein